MTSTCITYNSILRAAITKLFIYHTKPKCAPTSALHKQMQYEKISANLVKADDEILKYRQEFLNKRKYKGFDRVIKEVLPDWADLSKSESNQKSK